MATWHVCDVCLKSISETRVYGLREQIQRPDGSPGWTTRGAGSMDMCTGCWERIAKPRMRPWKKDIFKNRRGLQNHEQ